MQLISIYELTVQICIYMHYKSFLNQLLLCNSFAPKFSDRYTEPVEYAIYAKFKALVMIISQSFLRENTWNKKFPKFQIKFF
jgi:hypothetical protein